MANKVYAFNHLTGGTNDSYLDYHEGADLVHGDMAFGMVSGKFYAYFLEDEAYASENSPNIIAPDVEDNGKRWVLASEYVPFVPQED